MNETTQMQLSWLEWVLIGIAAVFGFLFGMVLGFFLFNAYWLWPLAIVALVYAMFELAIIGAIVGVWRLITGRKGPTRAEKEAERNTPQNRLIGRVGLVAMLGGFCIPLLQFIAGLLGLGVA